MEEYPVLDLELARDIELAEAEAAVGCAENDDDRCSRNSVGAIERIAGGYAVYCGAGNPVTQAVGLGLHGPVSAEEFDQLEAFYFSRKETVRVETCPLADATLFEHYKERHYLVSEFSNVMVRACVMDAASPRPRISRSAEPAGRTGLVGHDCGARLCGKLSR